MNEAIGYGISARLILALQMILTHLEIAKNSGALSTSAYSLVSGNMDPDLYGKVMTTFLYWVLLLL